MFRGSLTTKLDAKGRVLLGARFKDALGSKAIVVKGNGPFLNVFPIKEFRKLEDRITPLSDPGNEQGFRLFFNNKFQSFLANFYSNQAEVEVDDQARISIPKFLREEVDLAGDLIVLSAGRYLQIWKVRNYYQRQQEEIALDPAEVLGQFTSGS
jgi:MraZ protein